MEKEVADSGSGESSVPSENGTERDSTVPPKSPWFARHRVVVLLSALIIGILLTRPWAIRSDVRDTGWQVQSTIMKFHKGYNDGQFNAIYAESHSELRTAQTLSEFVNAAESTKLHYGPLKEVIYAHVVVVKPVIPILRTVAEVRAVFIAQFEKGDATELFRFVPDGPDLRLAMYQVSDGIHLPGNVPTQDWESARLAASQISAEVAASKYSEVFNASSEDLQKVTTADDLRTLVEWTKDRAGTCTDPVMGETDFNNNADGRFAAIIYYSECKNGLLEERLAFKIQDDKALLRGFHFDGPAVTQKPSPQ